MAFLACALFAFSLFGSAGSAWADSQGQAAIVSFTKVYNDNSDQWSQRPTTYYQLQARMQTTDGGVDAVV